LRQCQKNQKSRIYQRKRKNNKGKRKPPKDKQPLGRKRKAPETGKSPSIREQPAQLVCDKCGAYFREDYELEHHEALEHYEAL